MEETLLKQKVQSHQRSQDSWHLQEEFGRLLSRPQNRVDPRFRFYSKSGGQDGRPAKFYQVAGVESDG